MSAVNPRFSLRLAVAFFAGPVAVEMVNAQDGRTDARGSFGVPLQPFSLHETADASAARRTNSRCLLRTAYTTGIDATR